MPAGSYMKLRWMVMGCVNKQGQEIKCHIFWRANRSPETGRILQRRHFEEKKKQKKKTNQPPCKIFPSPFSRSSSLSGASLLRHKFSLILELANRQIIGHRKEKRKKKKNQPHLASYLDVWVFLCLGLNLELQKTSGLGRRICNIRATSLGRSSCLPVVPTHPQTP